jgi:hypothetical protein
MPKRTDLQSILILGSGPIVIGQTAEFDYSGTQAVRGSHLLRRAPKLRRQLPQRADRLSSPSASCTRLPSGGERCR